VNRLANSLQSPNISVLRFDHQPGIIHHDPDEEVCRAYAINFVEAGSFHLLAQKKNWLLSPSTVFISRPGTVHRYRHDEKTPSDVCTSVIYSGSFDEDTNFPDHFFPTNIPAVMPLTNRLAFLKLRLADFIRAADNLGLESWACELLSAIRAGMPNRERLYRRQQLAWYAERVETVREVLETRYADTHSLFSLSRSVGMSPFQFARVFSELTGLPPYRYLLKVRFDRASEMILDGKSVTQTCFDVGFSNLSHFTRSFSRRFGCVPSLFRARQRSRLAGR
jgi:AraC family transcriptional regulator